MSLCDCGDGSFMVFGGFVNGYRVNELLRFKPKENVSIDCEECPVTKGAGGEPCARTGHASGYYNGHFFVFGGQDDDNNKLGDMWDYDCAAKTWTQIT